MFLTTFQGMLSWSEAWSVVTSPVFFSKSHADFVDGSRGPLLLLELHVHGCHQHRVCVRTGISTRVLQREVGNNGVKQPLVVVFDSAFRLVCE